MPIMYPPIVRKVVTGILVEQVYGHVRKMLLNEQKGCKKQSRGTKDQLVIDKMLRKNC